MSTLSVSSNSQTRTLRVLSVHNRYQIRGGEEEVRDAERSLLEKMGHTVDIYEDTNDRVVSLGAMQVAVNTVWSSTAYQALQRQIDQHRYDVMHVHNLFPLISPAAYYAAKEKQIPVVQTLHNYRLLCPNALFFRNGQVCEDCLGKPIPWPGVQHGCYRENRAASGVVATMLTAHHLLGTWQQKVDLYIALTEFARKKFVEGGIPAEKVSVKPHFVDPDPGIGGGAGRFALYVGRLSVEKGLDILLAAWRQLQGKVPLKIVGTGTLSDTVIAASQEIPAVEYLGRLPMQDVYDLMGEASMVIVPSKWYETFGRVVIEAFAKGTPAIVSNIGAIAELVDPGRTGLHFQTGNAGDLATQVKWFMSNPTLEKTMRQEARREFEGKYTAATNYQQLIKIYNQACVRCNSFKSSEVHG